MNKLIYLLLLKQKFREIVQLEWLQELNQAEQLT